MAAHLTPQQVAADWGCSPEHVQRLCARGDLAAMRLGRTWRISPAAVEDFEVRRTQQPEAAPELVTLAAPRQTIAAPASLDGWRPENPVFPELWH